MIVCIQALWVNPFSLHGGENDHYAHFILNGVRLRSLDSVRMHLILDLDVQVAIVSGVWCARKSSGDLFPCRDCYGLLGIEDSLSNRGGLGQVGSLMCRNTYFQCVYCACGPVLKFTGLCAALNEMSNQARKACTSIKGPSQTGLEVHRHRLLTIVARCLQCKWCNESQILLLDCVKIYDLIKR